MTHAQRRENIHRAMRRNRVELDLRTVACRECGVKLRSVPVADMKSDPAPKGPDAVYHAKERGVGVLAGPPSVAAIDFMPITHYIDDDPRNVLRRAIEERQSAGIR